MKRISSFLLYLAVVLGVTELGKAQVIVNPDGTHSVVVGNVVVNPNGTHSVLHGNILVNPNGTHSVLHGNILVNPNGTHSLVPLKVPSGNMLKKTNRKQNSQFTKRSINPSKKDKIKVKPAKHDR